MKQVISIIGAGGKTNLVHRLAEKFQREGKKVLVTTTTHMAVEEGMDLSCDPGQIAERLQSDGFCLAGMACANSNRKFQSLPAEVLGACIKEADVTLIEADGAFHHDIKFPRMGEPVIWPETTEILLVMGLKALGKRAGDAVFRFEKLNEWRKENGLPPIDPEEVVTMELIDYLIEEGFLRRMRQECPGIPVRVIFSCWEEGRLFYKEKERDAEKSGRKVYEG